METLKLTEQKLPKDCYVFKHSTRCSLSAMAAEEVRALEFSFPLIWIDVLTERALSNWIADALSIKHESPQLIEVRDGQVKQVWNHGRIQRELIQAAGA